MSQSVVETLKEITGRLSFLVEEEVKKNDVPSDVRQILLTAIKEIGIRVRATLVLWGYELGGDKSDDILPVAVAVELMQHSTLVTDDILDNSKLRNNKPSIYAEYGTNIALLIGEILKSMGTSCLMSFLHESTSYPNRWEVAELFEETYKDVCVGQTLDIKYESKLDLNEEDYLEMIELTTARFIRTPLLIGAMLSGLDRSLIIKLAEFGLNLGLAYQIRDDVLDIIADAELTGKPEAIDVSNRRLRLPLLLALKERGDESSMIRKMLSSGEVAFDLTFIKDFLNSSGAIKKSIDYVKKFSASANNALEPIDLPRTPKSFLRQLSDLIATFEEEV